jgi:hypothetical protein
VPVQPIFAALVLAVASHEPLQPPAVVVLDFDAGELHYVPDEPSDPDGRTTPFRECAGRWPPLGNPEREAEIAQGVRALFEDFNVVVLTEDPPCAGSYVRVVIGPFDACGAGVGNAESSCDRDLGHGLVYVKLGDDDGYDVVQASTVIAHEVGHAFGLTHVDNSSDVMHRTLGSGEKRFRNRCSVVDDFSENPGCQLVGWCPTLHPLGQNTHLGLMTLLGPSRADGPADGCPDDDVLEDEVDEDTGQSAGGEGDIGGEQESCACRSSSPGWSHVLLGFLLGHRRRPSQRLDSRA